MHRYRPCVIISRGLYTFYPVFHCGLYCRAASITAKKNDFEKSYANFDEAAKLCKASNDAYNRGGWVAEGVAYDPYDFNA